MAVALGLASFSLGTDTAGSGRVPAAFNNLVGYKPTLGSLSMRGVVPACRSLDAMSIFALTAEDAAQVARVAVKYDAADRMVADRGSRRACGFRPRARHSASPCRARRNSSSSATRHTRSLFDAAVQRLRDLGGEACEVDIEPLLSTARLLYEGPWVAERYLATESLLASQARCDARRDAPDHFGRRQPEGARCVSRAIPAEGTHARRRSRSGRRRDVLLLPTAGTHYRIAEEQADPIRLNSTLGRYTNFVNLMDLAAVAVPAGFTPQGLPFGVSLIAPAWSDADLLALAARAHRAAVSTLGATKLPLPPAEPLTVAPTAPST